MSNLKEEITYIKTTLYGNILSYIRVQALTKTIF